MSTIKDVARETGLGIATISKYINGGNVREKNKIAIDAAIDKLGFTINEFARSLKTSKSRTIGVVIPELSNIFVTSIITVFEDILRKKGYGVIVCDCRTDPVQEAEAVRFLMAKHVDGIVNMPVSRTGGHLAPAIAAQIPVVLLDRIIPELKESVSAVLVDNVGAASSAVSSLIEMGHSGIGVILGPSEVFTSQQRLLGYNQALLKGSIQPEQSRVIFSDYSVQGGYEGMKRLISSPGTTAVFVTNYEMTLGAMIAISELGVPVPERVSLIGFDNMQLSQVLRPKLTVVTQPLGQIGEKAAEILLKLLETGVSATPPRVEILPTELLRGDTVKKMEGN